MKKSTLRRADLVFSVVLMVVSFAAMVESVKLLFNPFGRDFEDVRGDDIKTSIETWYQSVGLVPFIIAAFIFICGLFLFHFARKEGARFDFIKLGNVRALFKNEEFRVAVIVTAILCAYLPDALPDDGHLWEKIGETDRKEFCGVRPGRRCHCLRLRHAGPDSIALRGGDR